MFSYGAGWRQFVPAHAESNKKLYGTLVRWNVGWAIKRVWPHTKRPKRPNRSRKPVAMSIKCGDMVVVPGGRLGLVVEIGVTNTIVTHGASGPLSEHSWRVLRRATEAEVVSAGLDGVGHNIYSEAKR